MYRIILVVAIIKAITATDGIETCGSSFNYFPNSVNIEGCDVQPCKMIRGEDGISIVNFTVPFDVQSFEVTVEATVGIISVDYDLPEATRLGCNYLIDGGDTKKCPLKSGETVIYRLVQTVDINAPTLFSPELQFNLIDEKKRSIACYKWTADIF